MSFAHAHKITSCVIYVLASYELLLVSKWSCLYLPDTPYTGVTNYRCTYCLRQSIKQTILQKPINNVLFNYLLIPSMKTNDTCFKIKFNLLKT